MITYRYIPRVLVMLWLLIAATAHAQLCPRSMLSIPEEGGYVALKGDPLKLDKAMTVEVWVRLNSAAERSTILEKGNIGSFTNYSLALGPSNTVVARVLTPTGVITLSSSFIPDISEWHHYAMVFKPNDSLYLYVDGERSSAIKVLASSLSTGNDSLRIGHSVLSGSKNLFGSIDELRIWKIARTQSQIYADKGNVIPKTTVGLAAYLTFDDDASKGVFFENKGLIATLNRPALLVPSSSPVTGVPPPYKLQTKESIVRLPVKSCISQFDTVVHVRNLGLDSVHVTEMGLVRGAAFSIAGPERLDLPADSSFYGEIHIQFNPSTSGIYIDTLVIGSNSACGGQIRIPLIDTFTSSSFEIVQKDLTISSAINNCELPMLRKVTLRNTGSTALKIVKAFFVSDIGMTITTTLPISLGAGETKDVQIRVDKGADGFATSALQFESDVCQRVESIPVTIARETISYSAPAVVDFGERMILSDELVIDTTILFTNTSARDIVIGSASVSGVTAFNVTSQIFRVRVPVGQSIAIPVRFRSTSCGNYTGTLHVLGDPCSFDANIALKVSVTGPKPVVPSVIDFGFTCSSKDTTVTLSNPYDSAITLTGYSFGTPGVFTVEETTFPLTIEPQSSKPLKLRFKANIEKEYSVKFTMTNAKCGSMAITLLGGYGTKSLAVVPKVDFGRGCDLSVMKRDVEVTNNSPREVVITAASISQSDRYKFIDADLPVVVVPGETKIFSVQFTPEYNAISRAVASFAIASGCMTASVELYGSREEPVLTFANTTMEFDTLCPSLLRMLDVLVSNDGIDSADIRYEFSAKTNSFTLGYAPSVLKKGSSVLQVTFSPLGNGEYFDTLILKAPGCQTEYRIALHGVGGTAPELMYSSVDLQFGKIEVGKSEERCITISNPGCSPVTLDASSFSFSGVEYKLKKSSLELLPLTLANGGAVDVCIIYEPQHRAVDVADLQIAAQGLDVKVLKLTGQGVAPQLAVDPTELDFGFVPVSDSRSMNVTIENIGDLAANVSFVMVSSDAVFSIPDPLTLEANGSRIIALSFSPAEAVLYQGTLEIRVGAAVVQTVGLRGIGAQRGLVLDRTEVNFGDVRVGNTETKVIAISANVSPTTLERVELVLTPDSKYYDLKPEPTLPFIFDATGETLNVSLTFAPGKERASSAILRLITSEQQTIDLPLSGRGVDAHIVTVDEIDFGVAELEKTVTRDYVIQNAGQYPLTITAASATQPFTTSTISKIIPPGEEQTFSVAFTPISKKEAIGELRILSDAPEGERVIRLRGSGGDGTQSSPRIGYSIPDVSAVIGEQVTIPIMIDGNKLDQFSDDSFYLEFRYDPWMLYIHGFDAFNSVTSGLTIEGKKIDDSTYAITGSGAPFKLVAGQKLIELKGEALFGPRERTTMQIVKAGPSTSSSITEAIGEFRVTNCHDQTAAAIYKGAYSVEQAFPTPTSSSATIAYTLGFTGGADIEIVDALGRTVKQVQLPERPKGDHTFILDVTDLPNGHYSGLFRSREFFKRIDIIVEH